MKRETIFEVTLPSGKKVYFSSNDSGEKIAHLLAGAVDPENAEDREWLEEVYAALGRALDNSARRQLHRRLRRKLARGYRRPEEAP